MITSNTIYWLTRLDSVCIVLTILFVIGVIASIIWAVCFIDDYFSSFSLKERKESVDLYLHKIIFIPITTLAVLFVGIFVPTTKEACAMIVIPKIANNETIQDIGKDIVEIAKQWTGSLLEKKEEKK